MDIVKIFENDEEIKYRFNLDFEEEKSIYLTKEKIKINVYDYTNAKLMIKLGLEKNNMTDHIIKNK